MAVEKNVDGTADVEGTADGTADVDVNGTADGSGDVDVEGTADVDGSADVDVEGTADADCCEEIAWVTRFAGGGGCGLNNTEVDEADGKTETESEVERGS